MKRCVQEYNSDWLAGRVWPSRRTMLGWLAGRVPETNNDQLHERADWRDDQQTALDYIPVDVTSLSPLHCWLLPSWCKCGVVLITRIFFYSVCVRACVRACVYVCVVLTCIRGSGICPADYMRKKLHGKEGGGVCVCVCVCEGGVTSHLCMHRVHKGIMRDALVRSSGIGWHQVRPLAEVVRLVVHHVVKHLHTERHNAQVHAAAALIIKVFVKCKILTY